MLDLFTLTPDGAISSDGFVCLLESIGRKENYAALSHMWGGHQPLQLLKDNLSSFKRAIPWSKLPRTFQQAMQFTKRLGINYIWIDSLCIIQDSAEDWRAQSSKMASIYENAYTTLAASVAQNCLQGCFRDPSPWLTGYITDGSERAYVDNEAKVQEILERSGEGALVFIKGDAKHSSPSRLAAKTLPLLERGWVYQERLLSPRVLFFGDIDLMWECNNSMSCYCKSWTHSYSRNVRSHPVKQQHAASLRLGQEGISDPPAPASLASRWIMIVEEYSALQLTFMKDQLPAIAGIAKQFSRYMGEYKYASGVWTAFLIENLAWAFMHEPPPQRRIEAKQRSHPSWSWLAPMARVNFPSGWFAHQAASCPTLIATKFDQDGIDPFMDVTHGSITLDGYLLEAVVREVTTSDEHMSIKRGVTIVGRKGFNRAIYLDHGAGSFEWRYILPQWLEKQWQHEGRDISQESYLQLEPDVDLDDEESVSKMYLGSVLSVKQILQRFWCFALGMYLEDGGRSEVYLLLERIDQVKQIYARIGFGSQSLVLGSMFGDMGNEKQTVTLI